MKTQFMSYAGGANHVVAHRYRRLLRKRGFALVAALMMMILLVIISVALLSLSSISLRSTSIENASRMAKSNARLALFMALADLQKNLGPDQSITADASIMGDNLPRPNMVGVWNSHTDSLVEDPGQSAPDYSGLKRGNNFKSWLVSKPLSETENESPDYGSSNAGSDSVRLYFENEDGHDMAADVVQIDGANRNRGAYAWAVTQAATKASINTGGEFEDRYTNAPLQAPDRPNLELSGIAKQPENGWDQRHSKVISVKQAVLDPEYALTKGKAAELSREHTAMSRGLLVDVSKGGLKTDLSLGFEMSKSDFLQNKWGDLTNPFTSGSGNEMKLYDLQSNPATINLPINYENVFTYNMRMDIGAPPTFSALRSYYRMYKHMYQVGSTPTARQRFQASPFYSTGAPRGSETSVNPILDRVLLFLSISLESGYPALLVTPVVTLWNPYNVAIESDGYVVYPWMDLPIYMELKSRQTAIGGGGNTLENGAGHLSSYTGRGYGEGWNNSGHGRQAEPYFYCKITNSGTANMNSPVRLEPGEVKIFVPSTPQPNAVTSTGSVVRYDRLSVDQAPNRSIYLKPMDGSGINTNAGLRMSLRQKASGAELKETFLSDAKQLSMMIRFEPQTYHYFMTLEDAKRIRENRNFLPSEIFPRITETQMMKGQGQRQEFTSPFYGTSSLPKVVGVLETYHRVARASQPAPGAAMIPGADVAYTVNPRHRHTNYTISGASNMPHAHYASALNAVTDITTYTNVDTTSFRGFYGESNGPSTGKSVLPFFDIPSQPIMSLGAFQSADLANSAFASSSPFGNSWASPYIPIGSLTKTLTNGTSPGANGALSPRLKLYDQSYLLNAALWDGFYFSSIAPETSLGQQTDKPYDNDEGIATTKRDLDQVVRDWIAEPTLKPLRNTRLILYKGGLSNEAVEDKLLGQGGPKEAAAHMMVDGSFNVNSTNEKAWAAVLASLRGIDFQTNYGNSNDPGNETPIVRLSEPMGSKNDVWGGFRQISDSDIEKLSQAIVQEVRIRGPFQSLSEFVNRRLENSDLGKQGALQAAIEKAGLNGMAEVEPLIDTGYPERNNIPVKNTGIGTPGWITQADILTPLGPFISVRSDTFTVRAYGDARDAAGNIIARAYCEAVVQRLPDFVDPTDKATKEINNVSEINRKFGRKFEIVSIRELSQKETEI